jgi:hypothetical protein
MTLGKPQAGPKSVYDRTMEPVFVPTKLDAGKVDHGKVKAPDARRRYRPPSLVKGPMLSNVTASDGAPVSGVVLTR